MAVPEVGKLLQIDPAELMKDNPAALIVNHKSYELMAGYFVPVRMDPPQVLRVATFSANKKEVIRLFVRDGMTRTKYADDHRDVILPEYPDFRFAPISVRDVTASELRNPLVVPLSERREGQTALTMLQYLRSVVPPTVEHSEIAPDRIAAHLINGWENMVGVELSNRFTALAAISMLDNPNVLGATDVMLRKFLQDQNQLVPGEMPEERAVLQGSLVEMASIIRQTKLFRRRIAESAFVLVSAGSEVIGGERQTVRQVFGLLNTVEASRKLEEAFPQVGERERRKTAFGNAIIQVLSQLPPEASRSQVLSLLNQSLRDQKFSFAQISNIFSSANPLERFEQVRLGINIELLETRYKTSQGRVDLTPNEERLISNLGEVDYLPEDELKRVVYVVKGASELLESAEVFERELEDKKDELLEIGVGLGYIQESLDSISEGRATVLSAKSRSSVNARIKELKERLEKVQRRVAYYVDKHKIGEITDEFYGERTGQGTLIRERIVLCILNEVESSDVVRVKQALELLRSLPSDLQLSVIKGEMRLKVAQQKNRAKIARPDNSLAAPAEERAISSVELATLSLMETQPTELVPAVAKEEFLDTKVGERLRIEVNNQKLASAIKVFGSVLESLDLDKEDMSSENRSNSRDLLRKLGNYLLGHPDIVRVVEEDYKRVRDELDRLRESKVQQEQADITAETRTKI